MTGSVPPPSIAGVQSSKLLSKPPFEIRTELPKGSIETGGSSLEVFTLFVRFVIENSVISPPKSVLNPSPAICQMRNVGNASKN